MAHKAGEHAAVPGKIPLGEGEKRALVDLYTMALFWEVNEFSSAAGTELIYFKHDRERWKTEPFVQSKRRAFPQYQI